MGLSRARETRCHAAIGAVALLFCVVCLVFYCAADLRGQQDSPTPDESQTTKPPATSRYQSSAEDAPTGPRANQDAQADTWATTPRDLPSDQGFAQRKWGTEVRSMGYTAFEVLVVALITVPVAVLAVFGLRFLLRRVTGGKTSGNAAAESRWNRRECQTWRHELRWWRSIRRRK